MSQTLRRNMLAGVIRYGIKPLLGGRLSYPMQRRVATAATSVCLAPKGMSYTEINLGGVPCESVTVGKTSDNTLLWLHGGGYCVGSSLTDRAPAGQFSKASNARVIVPDYRLAPENPHPAALEDALAVYKALIAEMGGAEKVVIGGDSAGGGLTLALAVAIRDAGLPLPAGMVFCSPWVDLRCVQQTYKTRAGDDPWLSLDTLKVWAAAYLGDLPADTPACSPLLADLNGLPPALIQVGDCEILLDDSIELNRKFQASGVDSTLHVYPNMWHIFFLQAGILEQADAAIAEIGQFLAGCWKNSQAAAKPTKTRTASRTATKTTRARAVKAS
ncbi:alpha/beta hydrolase [Spongiibacter sp. KMU-158]|uniref:Alpha/beta hydrolase n=1 Tax=Spongiibacter pelagi TaxID=2760804 RepID=A0A927C1C4_9GAMM|nr:alpha/beta hydrolase [Spongiibacter pelagi]MBD2859453.1 alpha/beta hydrolase [Spongiibacter pelagi]